MGQSCSSCSSKKNRLKNKASQKRKNESVSQNYKENANDHSHQGSVAIPHESISQAENKQGNEKTGHNDHSKQLNLPENENGLRNEKYEIHPNDEKNELEFSQSRVKQPELSFEQKKSDFENEAEEIYEKPNPKFTNNPNDNINEPAFYQPKPKEDDSFEEEKKDENSDNLFDENLGNRPHHFSHLEREQEQKAFQNTETDCPICLESFGTLGEEPAFTVCGHAFCSKCLKGALSIHPYCPLCRAYQSKPLHGAQGQQLYDLPDQGDFQPLPEAQWNVEVVRAHLREIPGEEGNFNRRVYLSNGEATNIYVGQRAKIHISPNVNIFIKGKRVENPQDCNVQ